MTALLTTPTMGRTAGASHLERVSLALLTTPTRLKEKADDAIVRYDGWFLVLLAALLVLAFILASAMAIWCMSQGKGRFSGNWRWNQYGVSVWVECV